MNRNKLTRLSRERIEHIIKNINECRDLLFVKLSTDQFLDVRTYLFNHNCPIPKFEEFQYQLQNYLEESENEPK